MTTPAAAARRVLVVAYSFPPIGAIGTLRTLRVVRELHQRGWQVTVLTGDPAAYTSSTPIDDTLLAQVPPDVRLLRVGAVRPWERTQAVVRSLLRGGRDAGASDDSSGSGTALRAGRSSGQGRSRVARVKDVIDAALAIPDRESGWLLPALTKGWLHHVLDARPDVIYSSAPPWTGQLVAAGLKQLLRKPWVADFRDPWGRAPWRGDRYRFAMRAAARMERFVVRRADHVVFVTEANRQDFSAEYGAGVASKFHMVPNGCDPSEFDRMRHLAAPADGPFVLLHAGSLYAGRTPVPVLNALAAAIRSGAIDPARFRLRFLGGKALGTTDMRDLCRDLGLQDVVEFLPRVRRDESIRAMMTASALLLLQPGHAVSVPGKVYEYLAAGKPILAMPNRATSPLCSSGQGRARLWLPTMNTPSSRR